MLEHLAFKGEWRAYQKRILEKSDTIMADGHIHLVAAPGSGKTTLGIELSVAIVSLRSFSADRDDSPAVGGPYS